MSRYFGHHICHILSGILRNPNVRYLKHNQNGREINREGVGGERERGEDDGEGERDDTISSHKEGLSSTNVRRHVDMVRQHTPVFILISTY